SQRPSNWSSRMGPTGLGELRHRHALALSEGSRSRHRASAHGSPGPKLPGVIRVLLAVALAAPSGAAAGVPRHGVLVPGRSLAGVQLGDTARTVRARWGSHYRVCARCAEPTWYFTDAFAQGVGVSFRSGGAAALFTLGSPRGWRTRDGLRLGDGLERVHALYTGLSWLECIGYVALSMRGPGAVTSIYATGDSVYGFALTRPGQSICK